MRNLVEHEKRGTLKPGKARDLSTKNNRVIACLLNAGLPEHLVRIGWCGKGKIQAEIEEKRQIHSRLSEGCLLANIRDNPSPATIEDILEYLGVVTVTS